MSQKKINKETKKQNNKQTKTQRHKPFELRALGEKERVVQQ